MKQLHNNRSTNSTQLVSSRILPWKRIAALATNKHLRVFRNMLDIPLPLRPLRADTR